MVTQSENLRAISKEGNFGFLLERVSGGSILHFKLEHTLLRLKIIGQHYIESYFKQDVIHKYRVMKEEIHSELIVFAVRRNFALLPKINQIVGKLCQSGIIQFWSRSVSALRNLANFCLSNTSQMGHSIHVIPHNVKSNSQQSPVVLKIEHLLGAFYILILGNSLALMTLLIEFLFKSK